MFKKILSLLLVCIMCCAFSGCDKKYTEKDLAKYEPQEFGLSGFWAPYEISEESFKLYKDCGFNTLAMINHSMVIQVRNSFILVLNVL